MGSGCRSGITGRMKSGQLLVSAAGAAAERSWGCIHAVRTRRGMQTAISASHMARPNVVFRRPI